ncbi:MAG TPA: MarP family serine protease [Solirubrobacteraceae bacterium]
MTGVDWIIVALVTLLALFGYGQGFLVGALSLLGFAAGAFLGSRFGPELLSEGSRSPYAPVFALGGAVLVGGLLALGLETVGRSLRAALVLPGLGVIDGLLGALLSGVVALAMAWVFGAVALQTPGARSLRDDIQKSSILSRLYRSLPPADVLNLLARFDPFPQVSGPAPDVSAPDRAIASDPDVRAAGDSVVRITGTACGLGVEGSGWVAGPGIVVTNAHVVAGQHDTVVQVAGEGARLDADAVAYNSDDDVAVLRVDGLSAPALPIVDDPESGTSGAILGFPENGPYDVRAARIGSDRTVSSEDAYGRGPVDRTMTPIRGLVRSGNSGGPVVDGSGRVLTTVFAATVGGRVRAGFGVPNEIVRDALAGARGEVDTGPCAQ